MNEKEIKKEIVKRFKKRTGWKNMIGSVEKVVDELFPDVIEVLGTEIRQPNKKTLEAIKEYEEGKCKSFDTVEEMIKDLNK